MRFIAFLLVVALAWAGAWMGSAWAAQPDITVTLLGTGSQTPLPDRFGPATLVQAHGHALLFDAGRGVTIRLFQLGVPMRAVDPVFFTHYHSDHVDGLTDLWLTGWLAGPWAGRSTPLHLIGPTGVKALAAGLRQAFADDIRIRIADEHSPPDGAALEAQEFTHDGVVYDKDGVRVTAFEVNHGDLIKPAYGYRVDYNGHAVVISGDTRYNDNVIKYGTGVDLLVHEVCAARPEIENDKVMRAIIAHHTSPADAGRVFSAARPKLAVFSHIVLLAEPKVPAPTIDDIVRETRETYQGPLAVGADLMSFAISRDGVTSIKR